jgi:hypothetical protein
VSIAAMNDHSSNGLSLAPGLVLGKTKRRTLEQMDFF